MKRAFRPLIIFILCGLAASAARAEEADPFAYRKTLRALAMNRALLIGFESDYARLERESYEKPSPELERRMTAARYKIKALREEADCLRAVLPPAHQANELLRDMIVEKIIAHRIVDEALQDLGNAPILKESPAVIEPPQTLVPEKPAPTTQTTAPAPAVEQTVLIPPVAERSSEEVRKKTYPLHERALQLVSEKKLEEASKLYEEIVLMDPDDDEAYQIMGHTYLLSGKYVKAEQAFHNAAQLEPANVHEIIPFYRNLVVQNPRDDAAQSNLGYAWLIVGEFAEAKKAFQEALNLNPDNRDARAGLGYAERGPSPASIS